MDDGCSSGVVRRGWSKPWQRCSATTIAHAKGDLERFKEAIEKRGVESGA
jgi:uncharacterized protein YcbX